VACVKKTIFGANNKFFIRHFSLFYIDHKKIGLSRNLAYTHILWRCTYRMFFQKYSTPRIWFLVEGTYAPGRRIEFLLDTSKFSQIFDNFNETEGIRNVMKYIFKYSAFDIMNIDIFLPFLVKLYNNVWLWLNPDCEMIVNGGSSNSTIAIYFLIQTLFS
jgi:hypothetical protein